MSQGQMSGSQRDDLVRLRWVEREIGLLARKWREEGAGLRDALWPDDTDPETIAAMRQAGTENLDAARTLDGILAESRVPGGPPADHLADAVLHLRAFRAAAKTAGVPVAGRLADAIQFIEAAEAGGGQDVFAEIRQAGQAVAAVRAAAAMHLDGPR